LWNVGSYCEKNLAEVVSAWQVLANDLANDLIVKYNDGYINEKGRVGQTVGYPGWWLKA